MNLLQKLHKLKKHQVPIQNSKIQNNEPFNNSSNIDIIGIDVGKEVPQMPLNHNKEMNHHIQHLISEKPQQHSSVESEHNQNLLPLSYEHKGIKDLFQHHQCVTKDVHENHNCAICGESFDYLNGLAQHYLHHHKGYDNVH